MVCSLTLVHYLPSSFSSSNAILDLIFSQSIDTYFSDIKHQFTLLQYIRHAIAIMAVNNLNCQCAYIIIIMHVPGCIIMRAQAI